MRVGPAVGNEAPVPVQQGCWLDEEAPRVIGREDACEPRQDRSIYRFQRRSVDLAPKDCHGHSWRSMTTSMARSVSFATDQSDELKDTAERPVEGREGHRWMLSALESRRHSAGRRQWMAFSAPTGTPYRLVGRPAPAVRKSMKFEMPRNQRSVRQGRSRQFRSVSRTIAGCQLIDPAPGGRPDCAVDKRVLHPVGVPPQVRSMRKPSQAWAG